MLSQRGNRIHARALWYAREPHRNTALYVRNEKVSATQARAQYGVVLRDDGTPDVEETKQLRAHIRAGRKEEVA